MKLADTRPRVIDESITEIRAIKRLISERHGNDIDRLIDALMLQERSTGMSLAEPGDAGQPATLLPHQSSTPKDS